MGPRPSDKHSIDRIDVNGNYEHENCRWATYEEQNRNQRISKNNKSGFKGVCWSKQNNKWEAYISINSKKKNLGLFSDLNEAIEARKKAEIKYWK